MIGINDGTTIYFPIQIEFLNIILECEKSCVLIL